MLLRYIFTRHLFYAQTLDLRYAITMPAFSSQFRQPRKASGGRREWLQWRVAETNNTTLVRVRSFASSEPLLGQSQSEERVSFVPLASCFPQ